MQCIFCQILQNTIPASIVFENEMVMAFLDIHPVNSGHTLVVPKRHVESFTDLPDAVAAEMITVGKMIAGHLKTVIPGCAGVTLSLADGVHAGQEVPHAHLHLIPRIPNDGFRWKMPKGYSFTQIQPRAELEAVAKLVRESLAPRET